MPTIKTVIKKHQNNTDMVCQYYGQLDSLFDFAQLNGFSITQAPVPGLAILVENVFLPVSNYYTSTGLCIASNPYPPKKIINGGIGFMKITNPVNPPQTNDFIVS